MKTHLKNFLFPHEGNDHKPHLLREAGVVALTLIIVLIFGFSVFHARLIQKNADFTAAVLPKVLVDLANEDRAENGLPQLAINPVLEEAARLKAEHMAEHSYFAHVSPDGLDPWYWFYRAGYNFVSAGENLAVNFADSEDVEQAWMDSPGHRANILNNGFSEIGIAIAQGTYKGRKTFFVVQVFGTPIARAAEPQVIARVPEPTIQPLPQADPIPGNVAGEQIVRNATTSSTTVLGARVEEIVVKESDMYIEVEPDPQSASITEAENTEISLTETGIEEDNTSPWQKFLAHPRLSVEWGYVIIGLLVALVLILMIFIEMRKQHPRNIFYGAALLVLIGLLSYLNFLLISADLLIV